MHPGMPQAFRDQTPAMHLRKLQMMREPRRLALGPAAPQRPIPNGRRDDHRTSIPVPGYQLIEPLNTGGMSEAVNLVKGVKSGKLFIEKRVRIDGPRKKRTLAELLALQRVERGLNLNYMIKHLWEDRKGFCSFILEYCDGGSLSGKLDDHIRRRRMFEVHFANHILEGLVNALLNGAVLGSCRPDWRQRPSAADMAWRFAEAKDKMEKPGLRWFSLIVSRSIWRRWWHLETDM